MQEKLTRDFFIRDTIKVAKELLGKFLVRRTKSGDMIGKIIEVEAYLGPKDKASHSYNYKKTKRTEIMYEKPGTIYVYLIYGMYYCLNVITELEGMPTAVLIRQLLPIEGIEQMIENRNIQVSKNFKNLANGPGKLCMALNITKSEFNGKDCCSHKSNLFFIYGEKVVDEDIVANKRIGIDYAEGDKEKLLRFGLKQ
ncbi:MAG: DNA-3-methyladenine glycosylase [Candidatus Thorarchaeota archaeon]